MSTSAPRPGAPARGSATGRPIMALLDLLGRRMALRIVWRLREGPMTFRALAEAVETSPSVLNTRLKELRAAQIVALGDDGYELTREGRALRASLAPLAAWADEWAARERKRGK